MMKIFLSLVLLLSTTPLLHALPFPLAIPFSPDGIRTTLPFPNPPPPHSHRSTTPSPSLLKPNPLRRPILPIHPRADRNPDQNPPHIPYPYPVVRPGYATNLTLTPFRNHHPAVCRESTFSRSDTGAIPVSNDCRKLAHRVDLQTGHWEIPPLVEAKERRGEGRWVRVVSQGECGFWVWRGDLKGNSNTTADGDGDEEVHYQGGTTLVVGTKDIADLVRDSVVRYAQGGLWPFHTYSGKKHRDRYFSGSHGVMTCERWDQIHEVKWRIQADRPKDEDAA